MKLLIRASIFLAMFGGPSFAENCIEPIKPEANYLHDAGYTGDEIHAAFRDYFREVEDFLNCWNQVTYRVHEEARSASYELSSALRKYPSQHNHDDALEGLGGFIESDAPLIKTGELILTIPGQEADQ